ncbi:hypothetical protein IEN92_05140 [Polynucleobacter sp. MWH-Creno-3A4]|uniref:hypothetical protein n=1 Tax=Polynucleobacter sp. MWH-Creno-3A4 TaxID=1855886 RepID=UPI001C0C5C43|nr:hypothetical protein [Polynucleobacter sp. MWH-Creno-3A4]MBU3606134.1 hypothetical protein [Polynucleobacter sp. MWH-Creno-3A4]
MNNFTSKQNFIILIYVAILNVVFNRLFIDINIAILYLIICLAVIFYSNILSILPFIIYPFMYLLRAQNPENLALVLLPEITVIASCVYLAQQFWNTRAGFKLSPEIRLLIIYGILIFFINIYHVNNILYIPIIFRQYLLPVIFLFLYVAYNNLPGKQNSYIDGISSSIISFGMISLISLFVMLEILRIPRLIPELFPYLNYSADFTAVEVKALGYDTHELKALVESNAGQIKALSHETDTHELKALVESNAGQIKALSHETSQMETLGGSNRTFKELLDAGLMQSTRYIPFIGWVFRLNVYAGGVIGSAGAMLFAIGLIPLLNRSFFTRVYIFPSVALLVSSVLTISVSIFVPIGLFLFLLSLKFLRARHFIIYVALFLIFLFFMSEVNLFVDKSPLDYIMSSSVNLMADYFNAIDMQKFLVGVGPGIFNKHFYNLPTNFISDVGIFRIFIESGILGSAPFFLFLGMLVYKAILICLKDSQYYFLLLLLGVFMLLIHGNTTSLPPFYILFAAVAAGILSLYNTKYPR